MKLRKVALLVLALVLITLPVLAEGEQKTEEKKLAAIVNGEEITISEVDKYANLQQVLMQLYQTNQEFAQLLFSTEAGQDLINEFRKMKLDSLITETLLEQEARKQIKLNQEDKDKIFNEQVEKVKEQNDLTEEDLLNALSQQGVNSLEEYKDIFFENNEGYVYIGELQKKVFDDITVKEKVVKKYYDDNIEQYKHEEQVKASHILLETEEKANEVLAKIEGGEDFAEMAKEYSTGPSGQNGGDLGFFGKGRMVKEFDEAVFDMKIGEVRGPVKTKYGYHIIKLTDKREAGTTPYEEVKDNIKNELLSQKRQEAWNNLLKELREKAEIEVLL